MTILMLNTLYYPDKYGGAEKSVQLLAEKLVGFGHKVVVLSLTEKNDEIIEHNGVKIYKLRNKNIYWAFNSKRMRSGFLKKLIWHLLNTYVKLNSKNIHQIIKKEKPDVVHVNNISGFSTLILDEFKKRNLPIIQTLRDFHYLCLKNTLYNHNKRCTSLCRACKVTSQFKLKHLNKNANEIVGISKSILDKFSEFGLSKALKTQVIYNSIEEITAVKPMNANEKIRFGYIGSIIPSKGIEQLLELFTDNTMNSSNFEVLIAGRGDENYINSLKHSYPSQHVNYIGFQDPDEFYKKIDALVVPSQWDEPFGRVVIEGASYGLPIFVSKYGALKELKSILEHIEWFDKTNILEFIKEYKGKRYNYNLEQFSNTYMAKAYEKIYLKYQNVEG